MLVQYQNEIERKKLLTEIVIKFTKFSVFY
jgi:hypothetical protein